jgi:hypothetical protein
MEKYGCICVILGVLLLCAVMALIGPPPVP